MAGLKEFGSILKLIDDENEEVQAGVQKALLDYHGDASNDMAALGIDLQTREARLLSESLHPGRQKALQELWAIPTGSLRQPDGDFEFFEALLQLIADFLHDGVSLRPSLSDELDWLANEAGEVVESPLSLAAWLFGTEKFLGKKEMLLNPRSGDLAWCLEEGTGSPLGLSLIYLLTAQRLGMEVYGVNYPGHFLTIIDTNQGATLIDAFHKGRPILARKLLLDHPELSEAAKKAVNQPCSLAAMLLRLLANLNLIFTNSGRFEDAEIMQTLMKTVRP